MQRERAGNRESRDVAALREKAPLSAETRSRAEELAAMWMEIDARRLLQSAIDEETGEPLARMGRMRMNEVRNG